MKGIRFTYSRVFALLTLFLTSSLTLTGQLDNCLNFGNVAPQRFPGYAPGEFLFEIEEVKLYGQDLIVPRNAIPPAQWHIDNASPGIIPNYNDQSLNAHSGAIKFDFTTLEDFNLDVAVVQFTISADGYINLGVNDANWYVGELTDIPEDLAPGIEVSVLPTSNTRESYILSIVGNVDYLVIGGNHVSIGTMCYEAGPPCLINDLVVEASACTP